MRLLLRPGRANRLFEGLSAVDGIEGAVAVAVKDDRGDRMPAERPAPLPCVRDFCCLIYFDDGINGRESQRTQRVQD